jgi:hypothetical protein
VDDRRRRALAGLAANPATPPEVLKRLVAVPEARLPMARRPDLPDDLAFDLLATGETLPAMCIAVRSTSPEVRGTIARHPDLEVREMLDFQPPVARAAVAPSTDQLNHPDWSVRADLVLHPDLPADWRDWLAADPDPHVRAKALLRQEIPEPLRRDRYARMLAESETHVPSLQAVFALRGYCQGLEWVRDLPAEALAEYVDSPIPAMRRAIAQRDDVGPRYDDDPLVAVRLTAARRPDCPPELLERLATEHHPDRDGFPFSHPSYPPVSLARLATDPDPGRRYWALCNPNLPAELVAALARDPKASIRKAVAEHPTAPLTDLLNDEDLGVVEAAAANPRLPRTEMERLVVGVWPGVGDSSHGRGT